MTDARMEPGAAEGSVAPAEWRTAQHRVRNDLQSLGALWRLAERRVPSDAMVTEFPSWLSALAAVYDSLPLGSKRDRVAVGDLVKALRARAEPGSRVTVVTTSAPTLPAQMAVVGALAINALLSYSASSVAPGASVAVVVTGDENVARVEATFRASCEKIPWPPLGLSIAAESAGAQSAMGADGDQTVVVLVMPCR